MKGQMFSTDMVLSMFVFIGMTVFSVFIVDATAEYGMRFHEEEVMEESIVRTSDFLVRSPGYPENWTFNEVEVTGLADSPNVIKSSKFLELKRMDYDEVRSINRIPRYDFHLEIVSEDIEGIKNVCSGPTAVVASEESFFIDIIEGTGFGWDLYWSGGEKDYSSYDEIYEGDTVEVFEEFLQRKEDYECAVSIQPSVTKEEVEGSERLEEFVEKNVYVQKGEGSIITAIEEVGEHEGFSGTGTVSETEGDVINRQLSGDDEVTFESYSKGFEDAETVYVEDEDLCAICSWGSNTFFFTGGTVEEESAEQLELERDGVVEEYFFGSDTTFGKEPEDPETVVPVSRQVAVEDSEKLKEAVFEMVLWK